VICCETPREISCASFRRLVFVYWVQFTLQRLKEGKNNRKILSLARFHLSKKRKCIFQLFLPIYGHDRHFVYRNFMSSVLRFCSTAFWIKTTNFLATWKTGFPPKTRLHDVTNTRNIPQKCDAVLQIRGCLFWVSDFLAQSVRELWPIIT